MTTTEIRYGVISAISPIDRAIDYCPYEDRAEAETVQRLLDKQARNPADLIPEHHAPHRVVEVRCELVEVE